MKFYCYFNLQSQSFLCHEMAKFWQTDYPGSKFSGVLVGKDGLHHSFLTSQEEVKYEHLDIIDDIEREALTKDYSRDEIELWESRFQEPLWRLVLADRVIGRSFVKGGVYPKTEGMNKMDHDTIIRYVITYLFFFEKRLRKFQPDVVFFPAIASLPSMALAWVCDYLGIHYYVPLYTRILDRYTIVSDSTMERVQGIEDGYREISTNTHDSIVLSDELEVYLKSFECNKPEQTYDYRLLTGRQEAIKKESLLSFSKDILARFKDACRYSLKNKNVLKNTWTKLPFSHMKVEIGRRLNVRYYNKKQFNFPDIGSEPYVFFPLHVNPEASTMIYAPDFVDQIAVIEALSKNIPLGYKLYVKEHPIMIGLRPKNFYKEIKKYPNVVLVSPFADNFLCIRNAALVSVITGTAGWEGLLMGLPVLTFGHNIYTHVDLTQSCTDYSKLGSLIFSLIHNSSDHDLKRHKIRAFLKALDNNSFTIPDVLWTRKFDSKGLTSDEKNAVHKLCSEIVKAVA